MEKQILTSDVVKAKGGNSEAFTRLYESSRDRIHFLCLKLLGNEDDAADAVQDAFIAAYNKLGGLEDTKAFSAWLSRIAANVCKDYLKKNKPVYVGDDSDANTILDAVEESGEDFIPHTYLDQSETRNMIMEIIETKLSAEQKAVILLHYYNELSVADIAVALDVSAGTVKSRLNSARKLIKHGVEEHERKGVKLYTMAGIVEVPVLTLILKRVAEEHPMDEAKAAEVLQNVLKTVGVGTGAAAAGGLKAVIAKAGYAFKVASVAQKAIAVTVAVAIVGGGGTATFAVVIPAIQAAQLSAELCDESGALYTSIQILNREFGNSRLASKDVAHSLSLAAVIEQSAQKELNKPDAYRSKISSSWKLLNTIDLNKSGLKVINGKTSNDAVDVTFPRLIAAVKALCANAGVSTWVSSDSLSISTNALNLTAGDVSSVSASVAPDIASDKTVSWVSDNPSVATVDASGRITAVAAGNATVTASASPVVASAPVTVVAGGSGSVSSSAVPAVPSGVSSAASSTSSVSSSAVSSAPSTASSLSSSGYVLTHGESYPAVLTPSLGSLALEWHSSDPSVVTVDPSTGRITAAGIGSASVYATVASAPSASVKTSVAAKPAPAPSSSSSSVSSSPSRGSASQKVAVSVAPKPAPAPAPAAPAPAHSSTPAPSTHSSTHSTTPAPKQPSTPVHSTTPAPAHHSSNSNNNTETTPKSSGNTNNGGGNTGGGLGGSVAGTGDGATYTGTITGGVGGGGSN